MLITSGVILFVLILNGSCQTFEECTKQGHQLLDEDWRIHDYSSEQPIPNDDTKLPFGWYRFTSTSFRMLERTEMFANFAKRNHTLFKPCGSQQFQYTKLAFPFIQLWTRTTPLYVLKGKHPDNIGVLSNATVVECYYRSNTNKVGIPNTNPSAANCKVKSIFDPVILSCNYEHVCSDKMTVNIKIRNCGLFYVYYLQPVRKLKASRNFQIPKSGLYCALKEKEMPKPSTPCDCQTIPNGIVEAMDISTCYTAEKGGATSCVEFTKCLLRKRSTIFDYINYELTGCSDNIRWELSARKPLYSIEGLKRNSKICHDAANGLRTSYTYLGKRIENNIHVCGVFA